MTVVAPSLVPSSTVARCACGVEFVAALQGEACPSCGGRQLRGARAVDRKRDRTLVVAAEARLEALVEAQAAAERAEAEAEALGREVGRKPALPGEMAARIAKEIAAEGKANRRPGRRLFRRQEAARPEVVEEDPELDAIRAAERAVERPPLEPVAEAPAEVDVEVPVEPVPVRVDPDTEAECPTAPIQPPVDPVPVVDPVEDFGPAEGEGTEQGASGPKRPTVSKVESVEAEAQSEAPAPVETPVVDPAPEFPSGSDGNADAPAPADDLERDDFGAPRPGRLGGFAPAAPAECNQRGCGKRFWQSHPASLYCPSCRDLPAVLRDPVKGRGGGRRKVGLPPTGGQRVRHDPKEMAGMVEALVAEVARLQSRVQALEEKERRGGGVDDA